MPHDLAIPTGNDGSVTATPAADNVEYLGPVSINGQTLALHFDTGSADLWVAFYSDPSIYSTNRLLRGSRWNLWSFV
jgi:Eukaryotic aspartyl protease